MAVAGRVAPVPKGDYDKNVAYKRLDCVKYLNVLYIAKKDVPSGTAITDENYWMKGIEGSDGGGSAVIDDTQSSTLTTYSSNKLDTFVSDINQSVEATNTNVDNIQKAVSDINNSLEHKINSDGNVSETVVNTLDSIPEERILPTVGDKIKTIIAKTIKYFNDLKTIAFTGNASDLQDLDTFLSTSLLATEAGKRALDEAVGKILNDKIEDILTKQGTTDISTIGNGTITGAISTLNSDLNFKLIAAGRVEQQANKIPQNGQYTFELKNANIKSTDIVIATFFIKGTTAKGMYTRCICADGIARLIIYTTELITGANSYAGFDYVIFRLK